MSTWQFILDAFLCVVFFEMFYRAGDRFMAWLCVLFIFLILVTSVLWAAYESQHSPHLVTRSINGKVISSFTTTNSDWVETYTHAIPTVHGLEFQPYYVTNHYWTVWSIWK